MEFRIECVHCDGVATVEHDLDHHFYTVKFCPFCGSELEVEEEFVMTDKFEEEYEANN